MKKIVYILMMSILTFNVAAQKESGDVRTGNKLYKVQKFTEAEIAYRKGLLKNQNSVEANYNLGNALFKQKKYADALEQYKIIIALQPKEKERLAATYHNIGNSLLVDNKIEQSIEAYKLALKNNPKDNETRYNLAYAQELLKQQRKNNKDRDQKDDEADKIKQKADELVAQRMYKEAYDLMKEGEKTNPKLLKYADFTNRILDIIKMKL